MKFTPHPSVNRPRGPRLFGSGSAGPLRGGDRRQRELEFGRSFPPPAAPDPNRRRGGARRVGASKQSRRRFK